MIKFLVVAIVLFVVYIIFFKKTREKRIRNKKNEEITETLVECPKCGTFTSKDDAVLSNGKYFCSEDCLS